MRLAKPFNVIVGLLLFSAIAADGAPIIFLVRHAEKASGGGNDPELSVAGRKRAEALAQILKDAELTAIFVTEFRRTQETAAPIAKATNISPTIVSANDTESLVKQLRNVKGNALVVGHGNTIPDIVKALGITAPVNIADDDYSEIFLVTLNDKPQLLRLHHVSG
jgi:broad specificity phosphatase PhoE